MIRKGSLLTLIIIVYVMARWLLPSDVEKESDLSVNEFNEDYKMEQVQSVFYDHSGQKAYSLKSDTVSYTEASKVSQFEQAAVEVNQQQYQLQLTSPSAIAYGRQKIAFDAPVQVQSLNKESGAISHINTEQLMVDFEKGQITADNAVAMNTVTETMQVTLTGIGLHINLDNGEINIQSDVSSQFKSIQSNSKKHEK